MYIRRGAWFQFPLILLWMARFVFFNATSSSEDFVGASISTAGLLIMIICLFRIYPLNRKRSVLITSDIFRLTRHPMYHGMFLADAGSFFATDVTNPLFWFSWIVFVFLLFTAGWFQEKETLARWGVEAELYYAKTPRFIFEWLWRFF